MIQRVLQGIFGNPDPKMFYRVLELAVLGLLAGAILLWLRSRSQGSDDGSSRFRVTEAELRNKKAPEVPGKESLARARMKRVEPLSLPGIRTDGAPFEVLGVSPQASPTEIQKAYRDLMKRYHPDKVGAPGSRAWKDAQKIAEALNHAKDAMLRKSSR